MTLQEIKDAVTAGKTVHWSSDAYVVLCGKNDNWLVNCTINNNCIGLTWADGVTMNGKEEDFYIASTQEEIAMKPTQKELGDFVDREVLCCVSQLINELSYKEEYSDEISDFSVSEDWASAAEEYGITLACADTENNMPWCFYQDYDTDEDIAAALEYADYSSKNEAAQAACEDQGIDPIRNEALEYWIVSDRLAKKLIEHGELVTLDFLGLTIWGRCCSGQAILLDSVIEDIYIELKEK